MTTTKIFRTYCEGFVKVVFSTDELKVYANDLRAKGYTGKTLKVHQGVRSQNGNDICDEFGGNRPYREFVL